MGPNETMLNQSEETNQDMLGKMVEETYQLLQEVSLKHSESDSEREPETDSRTNDQEEVQVVSAVSYSSGQEQKFESSEDNDSIPGPGVVYALQFSPTTFILRLIPVQESGDFFRPDSPLRLRFIGELKRVSLPTQLHFFPTDYFELAEVISESFSGRRYPINDDLAFDLDQFRGQWWLKENGRQRFELRFTYPGEVGRGRYQKLGPLGDPEAVALIFDRARSLLTGPFQLSQIEINERRIILEGGNGQIGPGDLGNVILGQRPVTWLYEKTQGALGARFFRFLKEIQTMANFWQEVEKSAATYNQKDS